MEAIKNYVLSLTGFSFISSLVCTLLPDIPTKRTVKFICGVILAVIILSPIPWTNPIIPDIFSEDESYNLYNESEGFAGLERNVITDKVTETVENVFETHGITNIITEVVFDAEGNILAVNINAYCEEAANEITALLGLPLEIIHMTE